MKMNTTRNTVFTLADFLVVVAITFLVLLTAISIPSYKAGDITKRKAKARADANMCITNLRRIYDAKTIWALNNKKFDSDTPTPADLFGQDKHVQGKPVCPAGGIYTINPVNKKPTCSFPGHIL